MDIPARTPKHSDLIYDVGMHKGEDTEYYLQKGFRVVAFEAHPDLIDSCKKRFKEFLDTGQLTIVEGAIIDPDSVAPSCKKVPFYTNRESSVWGTVSDDWAQRNARFGMTNIVTEVAAINFADVLRHYGIPHYLKIDIEGNDLVCVRALSDFEERPTYISIESDKTSLENVEREIDLFIGLGYGSFQAVEQAQIRLRQAPPYPAKEGKYIDHKFEKGASGLFGSELGGEWKSKSEILRQYRLVFLGYFLLGDNGIMGGWRFLGSRVIRSLTRRAMRLVTRGTVPGWYDTHARLA